MDTGYYNKKKTLTVVLEKQNNKIYIVAEV